MGKHIITDTDLHRIDLGDGEYIDILERCTQGIKARATAATTKAKGKMKAKKKGDTDEGADIDFDFMAGEFNRVMLEQMIRGWSFKDKVGNPIPVTAENIARLSEETADVVLAKIEDLNPKRDESEKKGSQT